MRKLLAVLSLMVVIALTGCNATSGVRHVNLSPDVQAMDIYQGTELELAETNLEYQTITCYREAMRGCQPLQAVPAGERGPCLVDCRVDFDGATNVTVAYTGLACGNDVQCTPYIDDTSTDANMAKLRIIHASPDSPVMDVVLATEPQPEGAGSVFFRSLCFRDASNYLKLCPGCYDLEVRPSGTDNVVIRIPDVMLSAGVNYTIFITGLNADNTLSAMIVVDAQR